MRFVFRMRGGNSCACIVAIVVAAICNSARANVRFFTSDSTFTSSNSGLSLETFESANVAPGVYTLVPGPVDSVTANAAFGAGSLLPGFSITGLTTAAQLVVTGTGNTTGASKTVGIPPAQPLNVAFTGASAVGFNLITTAGPGAPVSANLTVQVYGAPGLIGTQFVSTAGVNTFLGIRSSTTPITQLQITDSSNSRAIFVDNLDFGTGPGSYNSRAEFVANHPTLLTEGFESAKLSAGTFAIISGPVNASTANVAFDAGTLLPRFSITPGATPSANSLVVTGTDTTTGGTKSWTRSLKIESLQRRFCARALRRYTLLDGSAAAGRVCQR